MKTKSKIFSAILSGLAMFAGGVSEAATDGFVTTKDDILIKDGAKCLLVGDSLMSYGAIYGYAPLTKMFLEEKLGITLGVWDCSGRGGRTTSRLLDTADDDYLPKIIGGRNYDYIFIQIGVNDWNMSGDWDAYASNLNQIFEIITGTGATPILIGICSNNSDTIGEWPNKQKAFCAGLTPPVLYCDCAKYETEAYAVDKINNSIDGTHPIYYGYRWMAWAMLKALGANDVDKAATIAYFDSFYANLDHFSVNFLDARVFGRTPIGELQSIYKGECATAPDAPSHAGATFVGWSPDGGVHVYSSEEVNQLAVTGPVAYTAVYENLIKNGGFESCTLSGNYCVLGTAGDGSSPWTATADGQASANITKVGAGYSSANDKLSGTYCVALQTQSGTVTLSQNLGQLLAGDYQFGCVNHVRTWGDHNVTYSIRLTGTNASGETLTVPIESDVSPAYAEGDAGRHETTASVQIPASGNWTLEVVLNPASGDNSILFDDFELIKVGEGGDEPPVDPPVDPAVNSWTTEPSVSPASWTEGETAGTLSMGAAAYGTVTCNYTQEGLNELAKGSYTVTFAVAAKDGEYTGLTKDIIVTVNEKQSGGEGGGEGGQASWTVVDSSTSFTPMEAEKNLVLGAKTVEHPNPNDNERKITNGALDYNSQQYTQYDQDHATDSYPATLTFEFAEVKDVYEVRIYSAWQDNGRNAFGIDWVAVKYDGSETYEQLSNVPALPYTDTNTKSQRATLICSDGGEIARKVRGIQFHFNQCDNNWIGLGEVEISGAKSSGGEPAENSWVTKPSVTPATWTVGETAGTISLGQAAYGEVTCDHTQDDLNNLPAGKHTVVFSVEETSTYTGLREEVAVEVTQVLGRNLIQNGGFESCTAPAPGVKFDSLVNCGASPWSAAGTKPANVRISRYVNGLPAVGFWMSESVGMNGTYCAVIEGGGNLLEQEIEVPVDGAYRFSCIAETRQYFGDKISNLRITLQSGSKTITVADGVPVSSWKGVNDDDKKPDGTLHVAKSVNLTAGTWTLTVQAEQPAGGTDTLLLDDFELRALDPSEKGLIIIFSSRD